MKYAKVGSRNQPNPKKKKALLSILTRFAFLAFLVYSVTTIILGQVTLNDKKQQLSALLAQEEQLKQDNEELQRLLNEKDYRKYMEEIAISNYDYAYPAEYRFYDTSRNTAQ